MPVPLLALTEIEAVNLMLATIGEAPISSLENAMHADALMARQTLAMTSREVQAEGWWFNTESGVPFIPDIDGHIAAPEPLISLDIEPTERAYSLLDVVLRGSRLYDRKNHTYKFTQPFRATIVMMLVFEDLPECVKQYVAVRAARQFQGEAVGSEQLGRFSEINESLARAVIMREQVRNSGHNFLSRSRNSTAGWSSIGRIIDRRFA